MLLCERARGSRGYRALMSLATGEWDKEGEEEERRRLRCCVVALFHVLLSSLRLRLCVNLRGFLRLSHAQHDTRSVAADGLRGIAVYALFYTSSPPKTEPYILSILHRDSPFPRH